MAGKPSGSRRQARASSRLRRGAGAFRATLAADAGGVVQKVGVVDRLNSGRSERWALHLEQLAASFLLCGAEAVSIPLARIVEARAFEPAAVHTAGVVRRWRRW
jgi:hypothetical protein